MHTVRRWYAIPRAYNLFLTQCLLFLTQIPWIPRVLPRPVMGFTKSESLPLQR